MVTRSIRTYLIAALATTWLAGCSSPSVEELRSPVPESLVATASLPGYSQIRFWGDDASGISREAIAIAADQAHAAAKTDPDIDPFDRKFLSVSGGGSDGAFGAGVLVGWSEAGRRPTFDIVTGIS